MSDSLLVISLVALGTYGLRVSGLLFANVLRNQGRVKIFLESLPPTILLSLVTPMILKEGVMGILATMCIAVCVLKTKNLFLAMILGTCVVALGRFYG
jgi:uncharacterized membrane protein